MTDQRSHFVSYSREDGELIRPIVALLRHAMGLRDIVFLDSDSIPVGADWRLAIDAAIRACCNIYVFWSARASSSQEVLREYTLGLDIGKSVIPILIDRTPLPERLSGINGINLLAALEMNRMLSHFTDPTIPAFSRLFSASLGIHSDEFRKDISMALRDDNMRRQFFGALASIG